MTVMAGLMRDTWCRTERRLSPSRSLLQARHMVLLVFIETLTGIGLHCTAFALTAQLSMAQPAHVDWRGWQKRTTSTVLSPIDLTCLCTAIVRMLARRARR